MQRPFAVIFGALAAAHASAATYEFRGIELGAPIEALRAMPYPDTGNSHLGENLEATVRLVCTGDVHDPIASPMDVYGWAKDAGVVKCAWMTPPDKSAYRFSWDNAGLKVGRGWSMEPVYEFLPDSGGARRLSRVFVPLRINVFAGVLEAITAKYGAPTTSTTEPVQNRMGAKFESATATWDDGTSSIVLASRVGSIDEATLVFLHKELHRAYQAAKEKAEGPPKI